MDEREFCELILRAYKVTGFGGSEGTQVHDGFFWCAKWPLGGNRPINLPVGRLFVEEVLHTRQSPACRRIFN